MVVRFDPPAGSDEPGSGTPEFVPAISPELLERHGGRVLEPDRVVVEGWPTAGGRYRSTVYRPGVLLIPGEIWAAKHQDVINPLLGGIGMRGEAATDARTPAPVRILLRPRDAKTAATIDSWHALQHLRAAAIVPGPDAGEAELAKELLRAEVERFSLEHLIATTDDTTVLKPWAISDNPGGSSTRSSYRGRFPVVLAAAPPDRGIVDRRPVIAVVDSGCLQHPLLEIFDPEIDQQAGTRPITVAPDIQRAITAGHGPNPPLPTRVIEGYWDGPDTYEPLVGDLADAYGHGTFIAGIIRQAAPCAQVLAIKAVHSDKIGYSADALTALDKILDRVIHAQDHNDPEMMVDVVSFSAGYYDEWDGTPELIRVVDGLISRGVVVVAAAGNEATDRPFYPAALAARPAGQTGGRQVIGVGALNPDGSKALFSNEDRWVTAWGSGVNVVSMYPPETDGSETPERALPARKRHALDPDKFAGEYAVWSGTSFATPLVAAKVANLLLEVSAGGPGDQPNRLAMTNVDQATTVDRARAALPQMP
ncbi:S8 family serine peptidase [Amycolatopsis sp. H6(2020)]|nr:S8 family serine peptidase [Amycolatopsis sp. H6(2020)]